MLYGSGLVALDETVGTVQIDCRKLSLTHEMEPALADGKQIAAVDGAFAGLDIAGPAVHS